MFGLVDLHDAKMLMVSPVEFETIPFIWEIDNRDAFKTVGKNFY